MRSNTPCTPVSKTQYFSGSPDEKGSRSMSATIGKKVGNTPAGSPVVSPRRKSHELGLNAKKVVSKRYSLKDSKGQPFEQWEDIVNRVVGHVSKAETGE